MFTINGRPICSGAHFLCARRRATQERAVPTRIAFVVNFECTVIPHHSIFLRYSVYPCPCSFFVHIPHPVDIFSSCPSTPH